MPQEKSLATVFETKPLQRKRLGLQHIAVGAGEKNSVGANQKGHFKLLGSG